MRAVFPLLTLLSIARALPSAPEPVGLVPPAASAPNITSPLPDLELDVAAALLQEALDEPDGDFAPAVLERRQIEVLADGACFQAAYTPPTAWQSSGVLTAGDCPSYVLGIDNCVTHHLESTGQLEETLCNAVPSLAKRASSRQRVEFLQYPGVAAGTTWRYKWRTYLEPTPSTSEHFFHLMQIFSRADNGPLIRLSLYLGMVVLSDVVRGCNPCHQIPLSDYVGKTLEHQVDVTYGSGGSFVYQFVDITNPTVPLIRYRTSGYQGANVSLKFGLYRAVVDGMSPATLHSGSFTITQR